MSQGPTGWNDHGSQIVSFSGDSGGKINLQDHFCHWQNSVHCSYWTKVPVYLLAFSWRLLSVLGGHLYSLPHGCLHLQANNGIWGLSIPGRRDSQIPLGWHSTHHMQSGLLFPFYTWGEGGWNGAKCCKHWYKTHVCLLLTLTFL